MTRGMAAIAIGLVAWLAVACVRTVDIFPIPIDAPPVDAAIDGSVDAPPVDAAIDAPP